MKVRFWGTRGSIATPGPGTVRFGGNTSCVELTTGDGQLIILDCGTGVHRLAADLMKRGGAVQANILLGHTHWDHIQGFPFFIPAFVKGNSAAIYGPEGSRGSLHEVLGGQMEFNYFPVALDQLPATISYNNITEGVHEVGGARVVAQFLNHPAVTLGYRIEADGVAVVYLADHEPFSEKLWKAGAEPGRIESILHEGDRRHAAFMEGADLVIHDAQYTPEEYGPKKTWGHSPYDYVVNLAVAAGVRQLALTHHDPAHDDDFVADIEQRARALAREQGAAIDVFCAYEGCEIALEPQATSRPLAAASTPASTQTQATRRRFQILVVEDDPDTLALIGRALQDEQHLVRLATNGKDAIRMADELLPDLVVLDFEMTDMDGLAVTKVLRAKTETAHLPVLMLTTRTDESSTHAGFEAGLTDYVAKPFSIPQLTARVRACLARARTPGGD